MAEEPVKQEIWKNTARGPVYVRKFDKFGRSKHEGVSGGKTFSITKDDRVLNQEMAADEKQDMFSNGFLIPVKLLDGDEDAQDIASNPNLMGEAEMQKLFKGHWRTFQTKVGEIANPIALQRLLDIAEEGDATVKQVNMIKERIGEVNPTNVVERDNIQSANSGEPREPRPVTPR